MSKKDDLIETIAKNKQVNVLLWFAVAVVIVVVCFLLYKAYRGEQIAEDVIDGAIEKTDEVLRSNEVSVEQIKEIREAVLKEYVTFSDMNTRVIDTLEKDGVLWGKNYLIQSAISCVEIGFDLKKIEIEQKNGVLTVNLGKPMILNSVPDGMNQPLVVRFETYLQADGDWTAADKMKLQDMVNEKMLRKCEEWDYFAKAREQAFQQIKLLIQHKLDGWQKQNIKIIIEE
ncbi:MAG: DUF4230 domain-containing protein [Bacteroidales bacterium]|nr:DUF4230 domain-containing protein [Bacteroidales bacterium]